MNEWRLFPEGTVPEYTTAEWYKQREAAPHLEQPGHGDRLQIASNLIHAFISEQHSVVDLGAGDGGLLSTLEGYERWGYDLCPANVIAAAERGEEVELLDVVKEWPRNDEEYMDKADLVIATEFLEHLIDPHEMVRRIHASGARWLIASSPYIETADSHYEFHTWAWDTEGYRRLLEEGGWHVLQQKTAFICQVVYAERA